MTPAALLRIVRRLPASTPVADRVPARTPHKKHWMGWLKDYDGPGAYGRSYHDRSAEYVYNHLKSPGMLLWINEAAGVPILGAFYHWAHHQKRPKSTQAAAIRKRLPWRELEVRLRTPRRKGK